MHQHQNYNHIRINKQPKHPEDQEINQIQDSYVFKTHPSLGCSDDKSKNPFKSQTFISKAQNHEDYYKKQNKTKRNLIKHQQQQKLMSTYKWLPKEYSQTQQLLFQQLSRLTKKNRYFQQQNTKLRTYVEFLQDYNLRLKKQLMRSIRRRNLDSSLGNMLELQQQYEKPQDYQSQFLAFKNQFSPNEEKQLFATMEPSDTFISKPIFTNQKLANQGTHRNISFGNDTNYQSQNQKYVTPFYQTDQKLVPHYYIRSKASNRHTKTNKNIPYSLQSSFLNVSNQVNPQVSSKQVSSKKLCPCINNSLSLNQNIATPVSQHQSLYRSFQHTAHKVEDKKTHKKKVCPKCLKSDKANQKSSSKKSAKNKHPTSKNYEKLDKSTKRSCVSCNETKSKKRNNGLKITNPTKEKPFTNIFHTNQRSQKLNNIEQKRAKMQKNKQKTFLSIL